MEIWGIKRNRRFSMTSNMLNCYLLKTLNFSHVRSTSSCVVLSGRTIIGIF